MKRIFLLFAVAGGLTGQILPTVPSNVFRFSAGANISGETWNLEGQQFALQGFGRHYFDHLTHNDSVRFSSNNDLYHTGTVFLDSVNTVEQWLTQFNTEHNFSLPVFGPQPIDTTRSMAPAGTYSEKRAKNTSGTRFMIEYGMSNEITLSVTVPILDSYTVNQSITDYSIDAIDDAQVLVDYHVNAKNEFNTFMDSNTFNNLRRGLRDTLQMIYDFYYTNNGDYSVKWAFQALDDPINNLLVDPRFIPPGISKDSVSLADLISYYYPSQKTGRGIDDVTIGATILLKGKPSWASDGPADALYGQIFVGIPYGQTISPFIEAGSKQFKEAKIGTGVSRWSLGLYGSWGLKSERTGRLFFQTRVQFSTSTTLNTPAVLFSGGHTHPDSILSQIGNTYKFDLGTGFTFSAGGEVETVKNRLRMRAEIFQAYKGKDRFVSKDPEWDSWMEEHVGYTSSFNRLDFKAEVWLMNSISQNRIGPVSFDLYAGFSSTLMAENTYSGWNVYSGITTYYQGW